MPKKGLQKIWIKSGNNIFRNSGLCLPDGLSVVWKTVSLSRAKGGGAGVPGMGPTRKAQGYNQESPRWIGPSWSLSLPVVAPFRQTPPTCCQRWPQVALISWFWQLALLGDKRVFFLRVLATSLGETSYLSCLVQITISNQIEGVKDTDEPLLGHFPKGQATVEDGSLGWRWSD